LPSEADSTGGCSAPLIFVFSEIAPRFGIEPAPKRWDQDYAVNNNGFLSIYSSVIGLNQNITSSRDRKPDDCDALNPGFRPALGAFDEPKLVYSGLAWTLLVLRLLFRKGLRQFQEGDSIMLWTILVILLVLWLIGLLSHVGGGLIHLLLVVAVVILIINLVTGRRAV
jgi:hypothetical protein